MDEPIKFLHISILARNLVDRMRILRLYPVNVIVINTGGIVLGTAIASELFETNEFINIYSMQDIERMEKSEMSVLVVVDSIDEDFSVAGLELIRSRGIKIMCVCSLNKSTSNARTLGVPHLLF